MATLLQELLEITSDLKQNGIEYAVCGGLAMAIHGFARATMDIDVLIQPESLEKAFQVAAKKGFDIKGLDISFKERAVEIRRVSKIDDDGEVLSLDLLLVTPYVEDVWESREQVVLSENLLFVVSRDGLIKMKTLANRPQDLADIERLQNDETG
ncbi:MAG TPA: nucleotidyltransferase family protein [Pyrinomonadaceae bacterium]|nr:nucleotidyltransferase family protein [Pyrinomonadaceae bacterium]